MSKEIEAVIDANEIETKNVEVGEWGLTFKGQLTTDEWLDVALNIQKFDGKIQWYLGDLAVYAESDVTGWNNKKEKTDVSKYDKLVEATGYTNGTMRYLASVARRFPSDFREKVLSRDNTNTLSFSHFRAVASFKEDNFAEYWLIKASENGWGQKKLQEELNKEYGEDAEKEEKSIGYVSFKKFEKEFFGEFSPKLTKEEYDKVTWLLEVRDVIDEELESSGIINV